MAEEGIEGIDAAEEIESPLPPTGAKALVEKLIASPSAATSGLSMEEMALACAELHVEIEEEEARTDSRKASLLEARKCLADRFAIAKVSSIRVGTTNGRVLVHVAKVSAASVVSGQRDRMIAWLQDHHAELLAINYNDAELRGKLNAWRKASEGDFPQDLVDGGVVKVYDGTEIRFRKSN